MNVEIDYCNERVTINNYRIQIEQFPSCCGVAIINIPKGVITKDQVDEFFELYDEVAYDACEEDCEEDTLLNAIFVMINLDGETFIKTKQHIYEDE